VETIARLYPGDSAVYVGATATEERAKEIGASARHLHFACHGVLDELNPIQSALLLTVPEQPREGQDDGLLQAWEIIEKVRLDSDLVTLSACNSGLGTELGGEGLIGLTRAFQYAGARSVLASLWAVGDRSAADLMQRFYRHLRAGRGRADALRAAQIETIEAGRDAQRNARKEGRTRAVGAISSAAPAPEGHPFRWAGFQLTGDGR
jgi:CHAT domain-containing protein